MKQVSSHYKLIKEHPQSYEIHDEKDGRSFHVAKHSLDLGMHGKLSKIKHYSKGGGVKGESSPTVIDDYDAMMNTLSGQDSAPSRFSADQASMPRTPEQALPPQAPEAVASNVAPIPLPEGVPAGAAPIDAATEVPVDPAVKALDQSQYQKALNTEKKTLQSADTAEKIAGEAKADAYKDLASDVEKLKNPLEIQQAHKERSDALLKAFQDKTIDPNRFVKNMSGGSKVMRIIGLIFGGLGAGAQGENPGITMLNKEIERDIEAQKNDQEKSYNLYKMNREATQDETQATLTTQEQKWLAVKAKVLGFDARAAGPVAAAGRAQLIGDIDSKLNTINRRQALIEAAKGDGAIGIDPEHYLDMVPEKDRHEATKEVVKMKKLKVLKDAMMKEEERLENSFLAGTFSPNDRASAISAFTGTAVKLAEDTFTKEQFEAFARSFFKGRTDLGDTPAHKAERLDEFFKSLEADSFFKSGTGIGLDNFAATKVKLRPLKTASGQTLDRDEVKNYIKKNIGSKNPKVQARVKFLIKTYGIGK